MEYETPISSTVAHPINQSDLSNLSIYNHPKTGNLPAVHSPQTPNGKIVSGDSDHNGASHISKKNN
jgi:hypothetical protein